MTANAGVEAPRGGPALPAEARPLIELQDVTMHFPVRRSSLLRTV